MLEVRGFRALRYATDKLSSLDDVITPPYDVINPEQRAALAGKSPCNFARLLLPEARDGLSPYEAAARDLETWIAEDVLRQDPEDSYYLLEQDFVGADGVGHTRRGFFAVTRLPEEGEKIILGHERTFSGPVEDRLKLTKATQANLGPIFVLYSDPDFALKAFLKQMDTREPDMAATTFEGATHRLWRVPVDPTVTDFFREKRVYIADGHHRFQTACYYRDQMRQAEHPDGHRAYDYVLMGFVSFDDPGLIIYPPHRLLDTPDNFDADAFLESLARWFDVELVGDDLAARVKASSNCTMGLVIHGKGRYLLHLRNDADRVDMLGDDRGPAWRDLDIAVLHRGIIEGILGLPEGGKLTYESDTEQAISMAESGDKGLAFVVNATRPDQVRACARAGEAMPQKATYFFPKLPSGMVIHRLK